jgi:hypothetical protein
MSATVLATVTTKKANKPRVDESIQVYLPRWSKFDIATPVHVKVGS